MGIDEKTIRSALLKGERITLEAKRAEKNVTKPVGRRIRRLPIIISPFYYDADDLPNLI